MLLYCPSEYMSKSSRADIVRRAVLFDVTLAAVNTAETKVAASRAVKTFLQRTFKALGSAEHQVRGSLIGLELSSQSLQFTQPYLESLVRSVAAGSAEDQTTLDIIDIHMRYGSIFLRPRSSLIRVEWPSVPRRKGLVMVPLL